MISGGFKLRTLIVMAALISLLLATGNGKTVNIPALAHEDGDESVSFVLNEENNSGQSGQATIIARGDDTEVILILSSTGTTRSSAAHIHSGQCGPTLLSDVEYELSNFIGGLSITLLRGVSLESLLTGNLAINTHDSQDPSIFTSCGNIVRPDDGDANTGESSVSFALNEENNSGQSGQATITAHGDDTQVILNLTSAGTTRSSAAHIHAGQCGLTILSDVEYGLSNLVNGTSTTLLKGVTLESLLAGNLAINTHDSQDASISTSCGNIVRQDEQPLNFALAPTNKTDAINGVKPFLVMNGSGRFTPGQVKGEGGYVLLGVAPGDGEAPILSAGTWRATEIVKYTAQSDAHQVTTPGILDFLVDFTPDEGPAIKGATLRIICQVQDSGSNGNNLESPLSGEFMLTIPQSQLPDGPLTGMHPGAPTSPSCQ